MKKKELTRQQKWYYENKARSLDNDKRWRANNPEKLAEINRRRKERFIEKYGLTPSQYYYRKKKQASKEK